MNLLDWSIVVIPIILLGCVAIYSHKYTRSIADYLACGRVAGRYIISVGDMAAGLSVITLVAGVEQHYQAGYSVGFWYALVLPVSMFIALSGFFCLSLAANPLSVFRAVS